ncbi:hypothetical protein [Alkaliphilus transvaalensis]|uniref:hypothetical protein n=1 Tax=Alkaliphilus transvaalensis TaxID=114628 RepID=UPI00047961D0|nr:hypothetical protein [Alkaliphilus transvaalensis]
MEYQLINISTESLKKNERKIIPYKIYNEEVICAGDKGIYTYSGKIKKQIGANVIRVVSKPFENNAKKLYYVSLVNKGYYHINLNSYTYETKTKEIILNIATNLTSKDEAIRYIHQERVYFRYLDENLILFGYRKNCVNKNFEISFKDFKIELSNEFNETFQNQILSLEDKEVLPLPKINFVAGPISWVNDNANTYLVLKQNFWRIDDKKELFEYRKNYPLFDTSKNTLISDDLFLLKYTKNAESKASLGNPFIIKPSDDNTMINVINAANQKITYELQKFTEDEAYIVEFDLLTKQKSVTPIKRKYYPPIFKANNRLYSHGHNCLFDVIDQDKDIIFSQELGYFYIFLDTENIITFYFDFEIYKPFSYIYNFKTKKSIKYEGALHYSKSDNVLISILY